MNAPAFSPRDVSERWQCSERHVRNLIRDGKLRAFRLGGKLVRIPREEFERADQLVRWGLPVHAPIVPLPDPPRVLSLATPLAPSVPALRMTPFGATVYFIRVQDFVKIGWATHVPTRLRDLEAGCPYEMEAILEIKGGKDLEQELHAQFAAYRHKREWFRYEGELKAWVEAKLAEAA